jgi:glutamine synthetase
MTRPGADVTQEDHTEIIERIRKMDSKRVRVAITDIDGVMRGKFMHKSKFLSAAEKGFGFCNVIFGWDSADECYDDIAYTGWHSGYPDAEARIDLSTHRSIPWDHDVPFFLADFVDENNAPLEVCPRQVLKRVISRCQSMGYTPYFGSEFEFFNFAESPQSLHEKNFRNMTPLTPGMFGYSILRASLKSDFFAALMEDMDAFGVPIEGLHTETGPGVYEVAVLFDEALEAADRATLFKTGAKEIGYRFGVVPTFMAKWNIDLPGCSGHLHQSLWSADQSTNLFYKSDGDHAMSALFESYVAGQLAALPYVLPFYAPTINSYKRLVDGYWAPTRVTWSVDNRTSALRVISGGAKSTRLETRVPGSDMNPYLGIAAALASGLYGIEKGMKLDQPAVVGNGYKAEATRLPGNLFDAAQQMKESDIARELFGDTFIEHFAKTRLWECEQFHKTITDWELQRYFEII